MPKAHRKRTGDRKRARHAATRPNAGRRIARKAAARPGAAKPRKASAKGGSAKPPPASPRFAGILRELDGRMRRLFPQAKPVVSYGMPGWVVRRPRKVEWTHGTMDPNVVQVFIAERAQGISLHLWNPYDYGMLAKRRDDLSEAGFKVMVGCLQFNRKSAYPVDAVVPLFESIAADMDAERAAPRPGKRKP